MGAKTKILEVLGGHKADLLLMEKVGRALQANERVKYLFTLLQMAEAQARQPSADPDNLALERRRAGIEDAGLDGVIPQATMVDGTALAIPAASRIVHLALEETRTMCDPLAIAGRAEAEPLRRRLEAIERTCQDVLRSVSCAKDPAATRDLPFAEPESATEAVTDGDVAELPAEFVGRLTSADGSRDDSLHLVVMDAHKALNSLMKELGRRHEKIGDVETIGLDPAQRDLVRAFTEGVDETRHIKGTHPGLATTATTVGERLLIQNDIGETDAHVILVELEGDRLDITYTDVHDKRTKFFTQILDDLPIKWKKLESRSSDELKESNFLLVRGKLRLEDGASTRHALRTIGSKLVFLIDWNKARKRLRTFLRGSDIPDVLLWAAREGIGSMAFLHYGDEELIYEALEALPRGTVRPGEPLRSILKRKGSVAFIKDTLRLCRECLDRNEPRVLLVDRLRCLLLEHAPRAGRTVEGLLDEMATLTVESALAFRDSLRSISRSMPEMAARNYRRVHAWETQADRCLNRVRKLHLKEPQPLLPLTAYIDDAVDAFDHASHLALAIDEIWPKDRSHAELLALAEGDAELALKSAQLFFRILHQYFHLVHTGSPETIFDTINELTKTEREGDEIKRKFLWKFLSGPEDSRVQFALQTLQQHLEAAMNALSRAAFLIHDLAYMAMERGHD